MLLHAIAGATAFGIAVEYGDFVVKQLGGLVLVVARSRFELW